MTGPIFALALLAGALSTPPSQQPGAPGEARRVVTTEESVALSRSSHIAADADFMRHMIVHHQQAVDMVALIDGRTDDSAVRLIGERISATQVQEIEMMRRWLSERGEPLESHDLHAAHEHHGRDRHHGHGAGHEHGHAGHHAPEDPGDVAVMPGMLTPNQMIALETARGEAFDRLFLEGMILHHQGALDMVDALLAVPGAGEDPQLSEFLSHVTADQSAEILRMQSLLDRPAADDQETPR
ncbi:MAG: DUF305 domain-containing protein [Oceanicaulis sp.]